MLVTTSLIAAALAIALVRERTSKSAPTAPAMPGMEMGSGAQPPAGASSSAVYISPARQQLIGVRTGVVQRHAAGGTTRTVGLIAYDETRVTEIHIKTAGWVEQLYVNYVGKRVRRGQPLFSLYSPDLVVAQSDYLIAFRARQQLEGTLGDANAASGALLMAAREKLRRWDIGDAAIASLEANGKVSKTLSLSSPFDGVVLERNAFAGQYLTPEMSAFKIGDLSTVWAIGQAFEYEAANIHVGESVDVEFPYGGSSQTLTTKIDFVYPDVDPQTRRIRFRVSLPNRDLGLKPQTYVTLVLHGDEVEHLVVPREAVIDTGARKYVLLALPNGYFDPRDVEIGPALGDVYPVLSGLEEGDKVVTSAQFLVDSETNLMAAMQNMAMSMPGMEMGEKPAPGSKGGAPAPAMPPMPGMEMPPSSATKTPTSSPTLQPPPPPPAPTPSATSAKKPVPTSMSPMPGMEPPPPTKEPPTKVPTPAPSTKPETAPTHSSMQGMPGMPGM